MDWYVYLPFTSEEAKERVCDLVAGAGIYHYFFGHLFSNCLLDTLFVLSLDL